MQALAILADSFRELRSRSLFWVTLLISVVVSLCLFGMIGFDEKGWRILWFERNESTVLYAGSPAARDLLSWLFGGALLWWWLTWGAIVVALIATASTIPDFVSGGSIDLVLAKPIRRAKLYLIKVCGALLFTLVNVTLSVGIAYLLMGLRFDLWFHAAWLAVPLVTLQFFYLFVVMSFVGLMTRSTLASLLAVLLFWAMVSVVQFTANQVNRVMAEAGEAVRLAEVRMDEIRKPAQAEGRELTTFEQSQIRSIESRTQPAQTIRSTVEPWQSPVNTLELVVPKTGDIQKIVANQIEAPTLQELVMSLQGFNSEAMAQMAGMNDTQQFEDAQTAGVAGSRAIRDVDPYWSIGTSIAFTVIVLLASVIVFVRRDF